MGTGGGGLSGVVVWIEPCVANDSQMNHRWATLLVKSGAVTGDELRKLSPFDLQQRSEFSGPVSMGHDRELAEATRELAEATSELKRPSYDPILPSRIADRLVNASASGNGCAVP